MKPLALMLCIAALAGMHTGEATGDRRLTSVRSAPFEYAKYCSGAPSDYDCSEFRTYGPSALVPFARDGHLVLDHRFVSAGPFVLREVGIYYSSVREEFEIDHSVPTTIIAHIHGVTVENADRIFICVVTDLVTFMGTKFSSCTRPQVGDFSLTLTLPTFDSQPRWGTVDVLIKYSEDEDEGQVRVDLKSIEMTRASG